jgi:NTP pyrophosphatase (non-canonical NTP hydrolase)
MNVPVVNLNEYQRQAFLFAVPNAQTPLYLVPALAEEVGEVAALFAKAQRKGSTIDHEELLKELGDVLWNLSALAYIYGFKLEDVAQKNINKLDERRIRGTIVERM